MDKKIGILGVGNLLLTDEGFGIHLLRYLEEHYDFPDTVTLFDAGTAGIYMAPFLEECSPVLVIDVIAKEAEPGSIHCFANEDIKTGIMQLRMSPHQLGLLEVLDLCQLREAAPDQVEFITIVPESLDTHIGLSPTLAKQVEPVAQLVLKRLGQWGCQVTKKTQACHA